MRLSAEEYSARARQALERQQALEEAAKRNAGKEALARALARLMGAYEAEVEIIKKPPPQEDT